MFKSSNTGGAVNAQPGFRDVSTWPPVLEGLNINIDEGTQLVLLTGRGRLDIRATEMTIPLALISQIFHTVLGAQLARAGVRPPSVAGQDSGTPP